MIDLDKRTKIKPYAGCLLIAEPFMPDARFHRTVILVTNHDEEGTLGFVLNDPPEERPQILNSFTSLPFFLEAETYDFISKGGPVNEDDFFVLHNQLALLGGFKVFDELHLGIKSGAIPEQAYFDQFIKQEGTGIVKFRFFLGSAGWSYGQLEAELEIGSWFVAPFNESLVFDTDYENLWKKAIGTLGKDYAYFSSLPEYPQLN